MPVNVLHISESDAAGGAARTAYKVHRGLNGSGHTSRMLVGRKVTDDPAIRRIKRNDAWRAADRAAGAVLDRLAVWQVWWWDVHLVQRGCDEFVTNTDQLGTLRDCARRVSPEQVRAYVNDLAAGSLQLSQNVNPRLALESLVLASPVIR